MSLEYGVEEITMVLRERLFLAGFERALERERENKREKERVGLRFVYVFVYLHDTKSPKKNSSNNYY